MNSKIIIFMMFLATCSIGPASAYRSLSSNASKKLYKNCVQGACAGFSPAPTKFNMMNSATSASSYRQERLSKINQYNQNHDSFAVKQLDLMNSSADLQVKKSISSALWAIMVLYAKKMEDILRGTSPAERAIIDELEKEIENIERQKEAEEAVGKKS